MKEYKSVKVQQQDWRLTLDTCGARRSQERISEGVDGTLDTCPSLDARPSTRRRVRDFENKADSVRDLTSSWEKRYARE